MQHIGNTILYRIYGRGRGWVFTPIEFTDLADPRTVGVILGRLVKKGTIRRLSRGLYDYPKSHPEIGLLSPTPKAIASAIAKKNSIRFLPTGAYAANHLGLSEQVPAKVVFLTDGASRKIEIGNLTIEFRRASPKQMALVGKESSTVIQALRYMGKENVNEKIVTKLKSMLSGKVKKELVANISLAPAWMRPLIKEISKG